MTFAAQLRAASASLSAREIAEKTGYSRRTVEGWRRGKLPRPMHQADILQKLSANGTLPCARGKRRGRPKKQTNTEASHERSSLGWASGSGPKINLTKNMITVHKLKTWRSYFYAVTSGAKNFEIRKNDRDFKEGDMLILQCFDPKTETYDGQEVSRTVSYMTNFEQKPGFVVLGLK